MSIWAITPLIVQIDVLPAFERRPAFIFCKTTKLTNEAPGALSCIFIAIHKTTFVSLPLRFVFRITDI